MKTDKGLERLIELARHGKAAQQAHEPPFGFSTRVAARALSVGRDDGLFMWERLAGWGAAMAVLLCILTAALHERAPKRSALAAFAGLSEPAEGFDDD